MVGVMDEIDIRQAEMLKTLAHPLRLGIVHQLAGGPAGVASIATQLGISQPNASQHLAVMRASGVVIAERNGREVCYRLFDPEIVTACEIMHRVLQRRIDHLAALSSQRSSGVAIPPLAASEPAR